MSEKYTPDIMTQLGRIGGIDWKGNTKALRALGINPDSPIKKACHSFHFNFAHLRHMVISTPSDTLNLYNRNN